MAFDFQPSLHNAQVLLRPLRPTDRAGLTAAASDPKIWAGHPAKTGYLPEVFTPYFDFLLTSHTALVFVTPQTNAMIGCSRDYIAPDQPAAISIGYTFLTRAYWGGAMNHHAKSLMLGHVFDAGMSAWFHIDPSNLRSQAATVKLGAQHRYDATFDLGTGPLPWKCYALTKDDWLQTQHARG